MKRPTLYEFLMDRVVADVQMLAELIKPGAVDEAERERAALSLLVFHATHVSRQTAGTTGTDTMARLSTVLAAAWWERRSQLVGLIPLKAAKREEEVDKGLH